MADFVEFQKIPRLTRECVITEKIDGTNACICIVEDATNGDQFLTGSRSRWITPEDDNFGFSRWAHQHKDELLRLGYGTHYGEWWGQGIQRGYGLTEKRFSLFNVSRWGEERPSCCHIVPVLYRGMFDTGAASVALTTLHAGGSLAAPGFMKPEGIVIFHVAAKFLFKKTIFKDEEWKGKQKA